MNVKKLASVFAEITAFTLAAVMITISYAHAQNDPAKENLSLELAFIKRVFETGYAPAEWKKQHLNWDLQTEYNKAIADVNGRATLTATDYRGILNRFLGSTRDYHVGLSFYATEKAQLPFAVSGASGRYFIVWINQDKLNKTTFPFRVGDELVSFGGRPVADVVSEIKTQIAWAVDGTDQRLAEILLTSRSAARNMVVPEGQIGIEAKRVDPFTGKLVKISREITWDYTPESIPWNPSPQVFKPLANAPVTSSFLRPQMSWGSYETWSQSVDTVGSPQQIGGRKSWVPALGEKIWESADADQFDAYIYRNDNGKLIGYVRIPAYEGRDGESFLNFKKVIQKFQAATDALVIDEVNNPGGSVFYVLALMSVLSPDPIKVPDHSITLWPQLLLDNATMVEKLSHVNNDDDTRKVFGGNDLDGYPVTYTFGQAALSFSRAVMAQKGQRLTTPLFLEGVDRVNPDPDVNYTKPIVVLINELDFSGGDFFPAILQDNHRAKMFGQRTAGAGGYVLGVQFPSSLGLKQFSFTGSIARRVNNDPIENLGVTPDVPYQLTPKDLAGGYRGYKAAVNAAVDAEISARP